MMPTSPPPPLRFRTVASRQYGSKASLSGQACPGGPEVKPTPGIPPGSTQFASALRVTTGTRPLGASRSLVLTDIPERSSPVTPPLYPTGPLLRKGYAVPSLFAPTTRSASLAGTHGLHGSSPLIPRAFAGRERPRRPARPSLLWLPVSLRLPSCTHAGRPLACLRPVSSASASAIAQSRVLGISNLHSQP
jgi:hypothetical protein